MPPAALFQPNTTRVLPFLRDSRLDQGYMNRKYPQDHTSISNHSDSSESRNGSRMMKSKTCTCGFGFLSLTSHVLVTRLLGSLFFHIKPDVFPRHLQALFLPYQIFTALTAILIYLFPFPTLDLTETHPSSPCTHHALQYFIQSEPSIGHVCDCLCTLHIGLYRPACCWQQCNRSGSVRVLPHRM